MVSPSVGTTDSTTQKKDREMERKIGKNSFIWDIALTLTMRHGPLIIIQSSAPLGFRRSNLIIFRSYSTLPLGHNIVVIWASLRLNCNVLYFNFFVRNNFIIHFKKSFRKQKTSVMLQTLQMENLLWKLYSPIWKWIELYVRIGIRKNGLMLRQPSFLKLTN